MPQLGLQLFWLSKKLPFCFSPRKKTPFQSNNNQLVIDKFCVIIQGFADDFAQ